MSAQLTRTTVAGVLGAFLAAAGPALATPATATGPGATGANDLETAINLWLDGTRTVATSKTNAKSTTEGKDTDSASLQFVSLKDAAAGKASAYRCKTVRGIRPWSRARKSLTRRGYRRLVVIRFTPRKVKPIAGLKRYAHCVGGWYVLKVSRGKLRYRIALNARTLKIAARVKIGVDRRRVSHRKPVKRRTPSYRPVHRAHRQSYRKTYRHRPSRGGYRLGRWRPHR